ncbi:MAG TPA: hypothetical protein VH165_06380 [Kofleriaceae bacterium]|nr:hypothetical protein [Kofleriaceae bacterium]
MASLFGAAAGCTVQAQGRVAVPVVTVEVDEEPPPPRTVVVETRPGFVFIEGHWVRRDGRWDWQDGHWERERAGQVWVAGRWDTRGTKHVWVEGSWHAGNTVVRDHREGQPADPVVRDHRQ